MTQILGAAALMGFVGSVHCVGMCGAFALSCGGRPSRVAAWQLGKLGTYAVLGALAGMGGALLPGPAWVVQAVSAILIVWFGATMAGILPEPTVSIPGVEALGIRVARRGDVASRALFGVLNGLLPCGLVYAALGLAVSAEGAVGGALTMAAFGLGTAPLLTSVALSAHRLVGQRPRLRQALALVATLAGLWVVATRGGAGASMHLLH